MTEYISYYKILGLMTGCSSVDIKKAYRKMSLRYHPDQNRDGTESSAVFLMIHNAYSILSDPEKRVEYDQYIRVSRIIRRTADSRSEIRIETDPKYIIHPAETLMARINFVLWEVEDLLADRKLDFDRRPGRYSVREYILIILTFIDKWILGPAGAGDYFMEAREMKKVDPRSYITLLGSGKIPTGHAPFMSLEGYFYNLRVRAGKLKINDSDLLENIPGYDVRLTDCIFEAQGLASCYLGVLLKIQAGEDVNLEEYEFSNTVFSF